MPPQPSINHGFVSKWITWFLSFEQQSFFKTRDESWFKTCFCTCHFCWVVWNSIHKSVSTSDGGFSHHPHQTISRCNSMMVNSFSNGNLSSIQKRKLVWKERRAGVVQERGDNRRARAQWHVQIFYRNIKHRAFVKTGFVWMPDLLQLLSYSGHVCDFLHWADITHLNCVKRSGGVRTPRSRNYCFSPTAQLISFFFFTEFWQVKINAQWNFLCETFFTLYACQNMGEDISLETFLREGKKEKLHSTGLQLHIYLKQSTVLFFAVLVVVHLV